MVESAAWTGRKPSQWAQRVGPRVIGTNLINNVYQMIRPAKLTPEIAQADMAPALQIGRMDVDPAHEAEWNQWYNNVYSANYEKVPGCIRSRRWKAVRGTPAYSVVYEFQHERVSESPEWERQRDINPDNARMRGLMTHAPGSPGVWRKTFQL